VLICHNEFKPDSLLREHLSLLTEESLNGPILDLACGDGHNGLFLASRGLSVILIDKSEEKLQLAETVAKKHGVTIKIRQMDLEKDGANPLEPDYFGAVLVFRYLHRPLIPSIKKTLRNRGFLIYETFTISHTVFDKPHNPDFLLKAGELLAWFKDWEIVYHFEGIVENPKRAIAQIVCRKP
jgi:SAM-dependent methyltransferase